jgi:hypothetical protein
MDRNLNDKVSLEEMQLYVRENNMSIDDHIVVEMFNDAASVRRIVNMAQLDNPLEIEEIQFAVRGRYQWDT